MNLFNASTLFDENNINGLLKIINNPEELRNKLIKIKKTLLKLYNLRVYNIPDDLTITSSIIAPNHLTDSDAPLIMSFYYDFMCRVINTYPELFVFAKENCFNGVSIPKDLKPMLEEEKIFEVDRNRNTGSLEAIKAAKKWFAEGEVPKHFLIFPQGTIYDINKDKVSDIERGAFWLAGLLEIPILPAFIEQAVEGTDNRLIFGKYVFVPKNFHNFDYYKQLWLQRVIEAQNELEILTGTPARKTVLDKEHETRKSFKQS
jgi:hypothetical protein